VVCSLRRDLPCRVLSYHVDLFDELGVDAVSSGEGGECRDVSMLQYPLELSHTLADGYSC
jgi:hypothetical protein